jgi:hypothetical protein
VLSNFEIDKKFLTEDDMEIINEAKKIKIEQNDEAEELVFDEVEISNILGDLEKPNNYPLKDSIEAVNSVKHKFKEISFFLFSFFSIFSLYFYNL